MGWSLSDVDYWTTTSSWGNSNALYQLSSADETAINGYLTGLYSNSTTAANMFDAWHNAGHTTNIGGDALHPDAPGDAFSGTLSGAFVGYDLPVIANLYYFNSHGALVHEKPELSIVHELAHMMQGVGDVTGTTDTDMNPATYDYKGGAVAVQNTVATELGYTDNIQAAYAAAFIEANPSALPFSLGISYTEGNDVDDVRIGTGDANDMDHTARTDHSNATQPPPARVRTSSGFGSGSPTFTSRLTSRWMKGASRPRTWRVVSST